MTVILKPYTENVAYAEHFQVYSNLYFPLKHAKKMHIFSAKVLALRWKSMLHMGFGIAA